MNQILYLLVLFPAIFFVVTGLRWLVDPAVVAPEFGLVLAEGPGVGLRGQTTGSRLPFPI